MKTKSKLLKQKPVKKSVKKISKSSASKSRLKTLKTKSPRKSVAKTKAKPKKTTATPKTNKMPKKSSKALDSKNKNQMNEFQQCVLLAAIINKKRMQNSDFLNIPLPDINSTALKELREHLAQYSFTSKDIEKAADTLLKSKAFKKIFPVKDKEISHFIVIPANEPKAIMTQLLALAGNESQKFIYLAEKGPHDFHRTTLEKHAFKTGQVTVHPHQSETHYQNSTANHKELINRIHQRQTNSYFGGQNARFSSKQKRGRG